MKISGASHKNLWRIFSSPHRNDTLFDRVVKIYMKLFNLQMEIWLVKHGGIG